MAEEGKYIYGIIDTNEARNFGAIGVGGRGDAVSTISYRDISAVISNYPIGKYELSSENLIAHQRVIEKVISESTVLPTRAFTVAANAEEVRDFLRKHYYKLSGLLKDMDNKIELGLIAYWKDMAAIFQELVNENKPIKQLKEKAAQVPDSVTFHEKMTLGEFVANALTTKKKSESEEIIRPLKRLVLDLCQSDTRGDEMIFNAAFLIDRGREKELDGQVRDISGKYAQRIRFKYVGPMPPYDFVNIKL